ncbi:glycosyltransferase family 39 protein [Nitrosomonas eutropha]|uniref:Dolichol-phosphate mannosyltransferase n=2 Tax=Nitrosomonas eutropha TaxID=916 RepID=A0ABX5M9Y3_9PROT|nr:glycosyltransferase family 39 protein [Nitrosomonas eutropha]ABI58741.1 Dolichyl-phosphate beta-D-mannosyltransferase [Nitrosomonas eutropha C91]PXV80689.1 dolichol-phosphate mannosyltransferase [Nitrosomonas eutropha]
MQFSLIIPTLNEAGNIDLLLTSIFSHDNLGDQFEVIIVDDSSTDGTPDKVRKWQNTHNVHLIERHARPDLTASILDGTAAAKYEVIAVMDADLSHPPERLASLIQPILDGTHDITIGSRYIAGGDTIGWPFYRLWLSRAGGWLARTICDVNDATSGFFAFRKELIKNITENARGYKILLELLMTGREQLRVKEIPIHFHNRLHGSSKLSLSHHLTYLQQLITLAGGTVSFYTASRFAMVGFLGVFVDVLIFQWMTGQGISLATAHISSFIAAASFNYALNTKWSFRLQHSGHLHWSQFSRFLIVGIFAMLLRGAVLAWLVYTWNISTEWAIFPAIIATAIVNYLGSAFYVFPRTKPAVSTDTRWRIAAVGIVCFVILLRLVYMSVAQLIPDEAYYWQYAQHMDLSFFDHPPMVAWLIWLGTALAGQNEFGVRIGAFLCGLIAMAYLYALARNLYDKSTAMRSVLLLAIVPFGFAAGLAMTPDAPLVAAWAATLYYMERALLANQNRAWLGVGIAFGLGILSKYTLGLLGIAALVFAILDPVARRWLLRPHPYVAVLIALILFSPVIIWNMENDWASFLFQTNRVGKTHHEFATPKLILQIAIMLTPVGLAAAVLALRSVFLSYPQTTRKSLFIGVFTGVPLMVFLIASTFGSLRFHWTGPLWLALIPTMAWMIGQKNIFKNISGWLSAAWQPMITVSLLTYAFILHYVTLGIPGLPYQFLSEHYFWRETTAEVEKIADEIRQTTGEAPIVVGMSKWSIASALAFYNNNHPALDIRSRNLFGEHAAMYSFWYPSESPTNRSILLIGMKRQALESGSAEGNFERILIKPGSTNTREIYRHDGVLLRTLYYRTAEGYRGNNLTPSSTSASVENR